MTSRLIRAGMAVAMLLAVPLGARAADLGVLPYKAPAYVGPAAANWSGFYVGVNAGYGFGSSDWDVPALSLLPAGALVGGTLGYNMQTGLWVWGLEADVDWSGMNDSTACSFGSCETKNDWLGTGRLRIGYAGWSSLLPYITGGLAFGDIKASSPFGSVSDTRLGWTAGAGIEYAFLGNWSAKLEYLYADLGSLDCSACTTGSDSVSFTANIVRAGVNYRF